MERSLIYEKIEKKCAQEADKILEEGKIRAAEIKNELIHEAQKEAEAIIKKATDFQKEKINTATIEIEQIARQRSLQNKKNLIDKVLLLALDKLKNLDDQKLKQFVINRLQVEKLQGDELIKVSENDFKRYLKLFSSGHKDGKYYILDKLNQALGENYFLRLANETANIDGGFIVIGKKYDLDYSFSSILSAFKDENEVEIAEMLFKGE